LLQIVLADDCRFLRRSRLNRNTIEFDNRPAEEPNLLHSNEDGRKIDAAEFDELERILCFWRIGRNVTDVLQMKEEKTVVISFDRLRRVAFASNQMGGIQ